MAVYLPSKIAPSVNNPFSIPFPIFADLATTTVFKRFVSEDKARFAGSIAGVGTLCFLGKQASLAISLTGAALYLLYKVVMSTCFSFNPFTLKLEADLQEIEKKLTEIEKEISCVSDKQLNAPGPHFSPQFADLINELAPETKVLQAMWEQPEFLARIHSLMDSCRLILVTLGENLRLKTQHLKNHTQVYLELVTLFHDPNYKVEKQVFYKAYSIFNKIYRMARCKGYIITLPNVQNSFSFKGCNFYITNVAITNDYAHLFITAETGPQHNLNKLFNETQQSLGDLLEIFYTGPHLTAQDRQLMPGDFGFLDNPFRISTIF